MKNNIKLFIGILIGIVLTGTIVYAATLIAGDITYDNTKTNINADNVQDAIDELYAKASSGGGVGSSELINNFSIKNSQLSGVTTTISIDGTISTTDGSSINGYIIVVNDQARTVSSSLPNDLQLNPGSEYVIKVLAIDKDVNVKASSNNISITTPNFIALDYPILTTNGWYNVKFPNGNSGDYTYGYVAGVDCTASDALKKEAYDGDVNTYETDSGVSYFKVGTSLKNNKLCLKFNSDSQAVWGQDNIKGQSGSLGRCGESHGTISNGFWHSTIYGSSELYNGYVAVWKTIYEIKYDPSV